MINCAQNGQKNEQQNHRAIKVRVKDLIEFGRIGGCKNRLTHRWASPDGCCRRKAAARRRRRGCVSLDIDRWTHLLDRNVAVNDRGVSLNRQHCRWPARTSPNSSSIGSLCWRKSLSIVHQSMGRTDVICIEMRKSSINCRNKSTKFGWKATK